MKQKKQKARQRNVIHAKDHQALDQLDLEPLFSAFGQAIEWALDVAAKRSRDLLGDVAAVERVREFARKRIAGLPARVGADDLLFALGLVVEAIEQDLDPVETIPPWFALPLALPSAGDVWDRTITRYFHSAQRPASSLRFATA